MGTMVTLLDIPALIAFAESVDDVSARLGHAMSRGASLEIRSSSSPVRMLINLGEVRSITVSESAGSSDAPPAFTATLQSIYA